MSDLFWTPGALQDRNAIYNHIEKTNPLAALALDELFVAKAQRLIAYPALGRPGRVPGTRELVVSRHYILIYALVDETVCVVRVLHSARRWPLRTR